MVSILRRRIGFTFFLLFFISGISSAQWGPPYTNAWINVNQPYVKITVTKKGIHKIPYSVLPDGFPIENPANFQLFYRGKELAIISTDNQEIIFYGVPNDGGADSLFYRPMSGRVNKYSSIYSDKGAYFLTVGKTVGKRAEKIIQPGTSSIIPEPYHINSILKTYNTVYSLGSELHSVPDFQNSFFEPGASRTGVRRIGNTMFSFPFKYNDWVPNSGVGSKVELLVQGMTNGTRGIEIYMGKAPGDSRKLTTIDLNGFVGKRAEIGFEVTDINADGSGVLGFKSNSLLDFERFSIAFYNITYPQKVTVRDSTVKFLNFPANSNSISRILIDGLTSSTQIYDISDLNNVRSVTNNKSDFLISRQKQKNLILLATSESTTLGVSDLSSVTFNKIIPSDYNYLIVTNELLEKSAKIYADYRRSSDGGSYKPIVVKIKDIYNQFNYGEIHPAAVRRFADFMISDGDMNKHLFIIGKSVNPVERMLADLDECIQAIGTPASDLLLVEGLGGAPTDVPGIPVGRLMATTDQHLLDYLQKVKEYEHNSSGDFGWRKRILHLNGGHSKEEISQFEGVLAALKPKAENGPVAANVKSFVKQSTIEVESVNVAPEVNEGVGMFTYFGHGSRSKTDLDFGYISDADRGYSNLSKYPLMYFNGCGVGNIFRGLYDPKPASGERRPLSLDWLLTPNKGAISIMANTASSYVSPTVKYLDNLYNTLFVDPTTINLTIGQVQRETARKVMSQSPNTYDVTNLHQSVLQGDPALHLISVSKPDYAIDAGEGIIIHSESPDKLIGGSAAIKIGVNISNWGKYNKEEKLPIKMTVNYIDGTSNVLNESIAALPYKGTVFVPLDNSKAIRRIEVVLDPEGSISELLKTNNKSQLDVDWDVASNQTMYPTESIKDIVAPILSVTFNDEVIQNNENLLPNPKINIILEDDRLIASDSTLIDVFIRPCQDETCSFIRLSYSKDLFDFSNLTKNKILINYSSELGSGKYQMLISAKDLAGNVASQVYTINFNILDNNANIIQVTASPNPASDYVRFESEGLDIASLKSGKLLIYNVAGVLLEERELLLDVFVGNQWYWKPSIAVPGLYSYKIRFEKKSGGDFYFSGKVVLTR